MIDAEHLLSQVIRPVLADLNMGGTYAEALVLGTACQESKCGLWLVQLGHVTAGGLGIYQMEARTHDDIWNRWLSGQQDLVKKVNRWRCQYGNGMGPDEMVGNLYYATIMCRLHYRRVPEAIPDNLPAQAYYWKKYYNTMAGAGKVEDYMQNWHQFAPTMLV